MQLLFESGVYSRAASISFGAVQAQKFSEKVNTSTSISAPSRLRKWRPRSLPSPFGRACKHRRLGSTVWRNQPRVRSSISRYALEAGSARLARKIDTYINTSKMAELPKMLERRDTGEPHARTCTCMYLSALD